MGDTNHQGNFHLEESKKGSSNNCVDNSPKQASPFETIKNKMAYHTLESKSICEKRDLNNMPSMTHNFEELAINLKTQPYLDPKSLHPTYNLPSVKQQEGQQHQHLFDKDHLLGQKRKLWGVSNATDSTSKENEKYKKSSFVTNFCHINLSTVLSWICCIVCLLCVYTTMTLQLQLKVFGKRKYFIRIQFISQMK